MGEILNTDAALRNDQKTNDLLQNSYHVHEHAQLLDTPGP